MTDFRQRFRLVNHAREKRGKERGCRDFWLTQPDVDNDLADILWEQDFFYYERRERRAGHMQLHVDPPRDMTEGSLAGLRDEPLLHFFVPFSVCFLGGVCSSTSCHSERKKKVVEREGADELALR